MSWLLGIVVIAVSAGVYQAASTGCKNCITLGKEEKAMFRAHSDACMSQSGVEPRLVDLMLHGELVDNPALKTHVYCVLLRCKVISKDGKLQKAAMLTKLSNKEDNKKALKVIESCSDQTGATPEELAWNLLRCGYDKKAMIFNYMPTNGEGHTDIETNLN
ncbi:PBP/GOBP family domain-containing protein [Phthorimaea operculella]|nr:PBP/GOBP family domain-containing protein [Phthorimaea operculella]